MSELPGEDAAAYELPSGQTVEIKAGETVTVAMHNRLIPKEIPKTGDLPWLPWTIGGAAVLSLGGWGFCLPCGEERNDKTREERKRKMDTKAILLIILCAVILGGLVFLHIRNRRRK